MSDMVERVEAVINEKLIATWSSESPLAKAALRQLSTTLARAAIEACAAEIDALVERRKADKRNQGNDHILATAAFLRHAALKGEAE